MFDVEVLMGKLKYRSSHIEPVYASDQPWFCIIGKLVAVVREPILERAFTPCISGGIFYLLGRISHGSNKVY